MQHKQNLHTHCTFCDGVHTAEQMVQFAIDKGFDSLGFSSHSYEPYAPLMGMHDPAPYKAEVLRLKEKYRDVLKIYLGMEVDMFYETDLSSCQYLIGSVHRILKDGMALSFDRSAAVVQALLDDHFHGDGMAFARAYYEHLALLPQYGDFDIIGHFDIISKNIDFIPLFDQDSPEYLSIAFEAMHALKGHIPFFEVNTGAIARGYRKTPYPTVPILKEFKRLGFGAIIASDCHDGNHLDCCFDQARELLLSCGFREQYIFTDTGFQAIGL